MDFILKIKDCLEGSTTLYMPDSLFGDVDYVKNECVMSSGPGGGSTTVHARASEPVNQTHPVDCWRLFN